MPNIRDLTDHQLLQELGDCETRIHFLKDEIRSRNEKKLPGIGKAFQDLMLAKSQMERNRIPDQKGLEDRVQSIEEIVHPPGEVRGTTISRVLGVGESSGVRWCVGLGMMNMPKVFGYGSTISLALEDSFQKFKETK